MNNQFFKLLTSILLLFIIPPASGQILSVPSPTAANLGLYGDIPVSYYTGTPNITIPLYEIKGKNLSLPITLTYHPSAIRPEIHPGPTGLGWTLQAGGVISRVVRGRSADECQIEVKGYLDQAGGWLASDGWKTKIQNDCSDPSTLRDSIKRKRQFDVEPDEFSFSVSGLSGKFYFDHYGNIQVQCDRPVKVIFNNEFIQAGEIGFAYPCTLNRFERMIKGFTIIDELGTRYSFGGKDAMELSDPIAYKDGYGIEANGYLLQATSWFLTKIESADGVDLINFTYERGPFISQLFFSYNAFENRTDRSAEWNATLLKKDGTFIMPVYLTKIERTNGETISIKLVESSELSYDETHYYNILYPSAGSFPLLDRYASIPRLNNPVLKEKLDRIKWMKINSIYITNNQNQALKTITFSYNYNPAERLFLEQLLIFGGFAGIAPAAAGTEIQPAPIPGDELTRPLVYSFSYKDRNKMPGYLESYTDHWGFNNGSGNIPNSPIFQLREPDVDYAFSGILDTIYYPTGGYSSFEYELHDYSKALTSDRTMLLERYGVAGGPRIKKITNNDGRDHTVSRAFFYTTGLSSATSSGVLNAFPVYSSLVTGKNTSQESFHLYYDRSFPVIPLTKENDGQYIGYTSVIEKISNGGGAVQYIFTNHDNGHCDAPPLYTWQQSISNSKPHNSRFFERGKLLEKISYNNHGLPVEKQITRWSRYGSQDEENPRTLLFESIDIGTGAYYHTAAYLHYTYKFLPSQKITYGYDANGEHPVITTTNFTYSLSPEGLLSSKESTDSRGDVIKNVYHYALEVGHMNMIDRHMIGIPIETITYRNNMVTDVLLQAYQDYGGRLLPAFQNKLQTNTPVNNYLLYSTSQMDSRLQREYSFERYDSKGNLLQVKGKDGITISYIWGYQYQHPIAKIIGADYSQVKAALGRTNDNNDLAYLQDYSTEQLLTAFNKLRENLPSAIVTTYTYTPQQGITSETSPDGVTTYYEYDPLGRLMRIKDHLGNILQENSYHYGNE